MFLYIDHCNIISAVCKPCNFCKLAKFTNLASKIKTIAISFNIAYKSCYPCNSCKACKSCEAWKNWVSTIYSIDRNSLLTQSLKIHKLLRLLVALLCPAHEIGWSSNCTYDFVKMFLGRGIMRRACLTGSAPNCLCSLEELTQKLTLREAKSATRWTIPKAYVGISRIILWNTTSNGIPTILGQGAYY